MAQFASISPASLMRLIGTPNAPEIIDVCLQEDFDNDPYLIPTARRCPHISIEDRMPELAGKRVVVVCQKGLKLSQGAAALLRTHGIRAEVLEGGNMAWRAADLPRVPEAALRRTGPHTRWVTRHRPKIDRIACPWLIRRFVDPHAQFLFVPPSDVAAVAEKFDATAFDMPDAPWTHAGPLCTFDAIVEGFGLRYPALDRMARVIRGADTNKHTLAPECAGLLALSVGLSRAHADDQAQLDVGMVLYDALYRWARDGQNETHDWQEDAA
ncbi:chromate resistance protein ChrB domain-containing protein [uncultured Roseobacter sp.]|uniref:chromate resistance protein ChrB domain-containing protein n=1 Tax=uncultured Roseobacter sp. TaxID=114847 RepID=UPI00260C9DF8|nr:chromate resistance protein ChrB domain-containing protein [uncultured Roseobacter sp.]